MIIARLAVYAAIAVTMYVNGSNAWSKGGSPADQFAMLAMALAIDGCKCSFLRVASLCKQDGRSFPATLLFLMWCPCLAYSTYAGYSYLHSNRTTVSTGKQGMAEERQRAQAAHDQAAADLRLATANPLWATTSACTTITKGKAKEFCETVTGLRDDQAAAAAILTRIAPTDANPEVTGLAANTGLTPERVQFLIALVPAMLVELLASVGFYAIGKHPTEIAPRKPVGAFWRSWLSMPGSSQKTLPVKLSTASGAIEKPMQPDKPTITPIQQTIKWQLPS
jgi:hypothetical protein